MDKAKEDGLTGAVKKEEDEKAFYVSAALQASNDLTRKTFEELALEEDSHRKKVLEVYEALKKDGVFRKWTAAAATPFRIEGPFQNAEMQNAAACVDDKCALRIGLDMEEKSVKYYEKLAASAEDVYEKRFYLVLSYEERGHYLRIMDAIEYLTDPVGWHYIHQRSMVDGG